MAWNRANALSGCPRGRGEGLAMRVPREEGREQQEALQLKIQLLFGRLTRQQPQREVPPFSLSRSKTSKLTFNPTNPCSHSPGERLRELRERLQGELDFQFEILTEDYSVLLRAQEELRAEREAGQKAGREGLGAIGGTLERLKEMALSLTFQRRHLKLYSRIVKGLPECPPQTPFRLSLTPHRDNSLLISVKRSLENFPSHQSLKKTEKSAQNFDESYKYSEQPNEQPNEKERQSSFKDFIKQTEEEDDLNVSFQALERSILQRLHVGGSSSKVLERSKERMQGLASEVEQLSVSVGEQRRACVQEWRGLEAALRSELGTLAEWLSEARRSTEALEREQGEILCLMEQSVSSALGAERRASGHEHVSILGHLQQVISIFA